MQKVVGSNPISRFLSMPVELSPIAPADIRRIAGFLHANMDDSVSTERWAQLIERTWDFERPNLGFMLLDGDRVVGAYLAYYSERELNGRPARLCNLGTWCVMPRWRLHSVRLLDALLAQEGYLFTDFTPDQTVIALNLRLGFRWLDGPAALVPNLPWPSRPGRGRVSSDPEVIERALSGRDLRTYRDHMGPERIRSTVLSRDDERCLVIFRRERRRGIPVATLFHVSNAGLLRDLSGPFARHLLGRHRVLAHLVEERMVKDLPRLALRVPPPLRMLRGGGEGERREIDYLYSELVRLTW